MIPTRATDLLDLRSSIIRSGSSIKRCFNQPKARSSTKSRSSFAALRVKLTVGVHAAGANRRFVLVLRLWPGDLSNSQKVLWLGGHIFDCFPAILRRHVQSESLPSGWKAGDLQSSWISSLLVLQLQTDWPQTFLRWNSPRGLRTSCREVTHSNS